MTDLTELLADCNARGIRLLPADDGGLIIDAPQAALTPDLMDRLKSNKAELRASLKRMPDVALPLTEAVEGGAVPAKPVCRCGSTTWRDVPIHDGQSIRRDCGKCGRLVCFPRWYAPDKPHA